ncbi:hypothetical protein PAMP_013915 [Pampus punctatissimus]
MAPLGVTSSPFAAWCSQTPPSPSPYQPPRPRHHDPTPRLVLSSVQSQPRGERERCQKKLLNR